jgi:pimeloyl-ACP methyl ester carboxylesterase
MQQHFCTSSYRSGESHRMAYTEWGDPDNPKLLFCAHGLSRNSRDFDSLAAVMAGQYHVVCPDFPGRGLSEKLVNDEDYENLNYLVDSLNLLSRLDKETVDWVGTSMGGIIGMCLAAKENSPLHKLVLNDVGTLIPQAGA